MGLKQRLIHLLRDEGGFLGLGDLFSVVGKGFGKLFGGDKPRIDPTTALLGGLSLFGGGDDFQRRKSFQGTSVDPIQSLTEARNASLRLGQGLSEQKTRRRGINPIQIEGIPFQIGGGLHTEEERGLPGMQYDPFQGIAKNQFSGGESRGTRRREPNNASSKRRGE